MKDRFKNLAATFSIFTDEFDLSLDQNLGSLDLSIQQGHINKQGLKEELDLALSDPKFEWLEFAKENRLIVIEIDNHTDESIKKYFKSLVWDYLFSDK
ncbi:MAG: hypothetical protein RJQ09_15625 [Cyclobacteriaceae bacterium]